MLAPTGNHGAWVDMGTDSGLREGMLLFIEGVAVLPEFRELWGGRREIPRAYEIVEVEGHRCRIVDVHRGQAETMLVPVATGSVVTSLRPPGVQLVPMRAPSGSLQEPQAARG